MESVSGVRCGIAKGGNCGVGKHGKTRFRAREEPMVQGHGTSLPGTAWTWHCDTGVHMGIIMKFSEALPCVKSPVSRTLGPIYVVTCVENVLVRTPWKVTRNEVERASVETTKGWLVRRESEEK